MRKIMTFILSIGLISGGSYWGWIEYQYAERIKMIVAAVIAVILFLGFYLLWEDFLKQFFVAGDKNKG